MEGPFILPAGGWAILELLGHRREVGLVEITSLDEGGTEPLLRVETPRWNLHGERIDPRVTYLGPAAIYAITPVNEAEAIAELEPWVTCGEPVNAPDAPDDATCGLRKGHSGDHDQDIPF